MRMGTLETVITPTVCILAVLLLVSLLVIALLVFIIARQRSYLSHKSLHSKRGSEIRLSLYTNISKALRTPLNIINESCQTLQDKGVKQLSEAEYRTLISNIHTNSHRMLSSLDELKEVTSFSGNVPQFSMLEVDLVELVTSYRREILRETRRGVVVGIHTAISSNCKATLNTPMFRQLIMHLLRVCADRTTEGHINISYKQEGAGLRFLIEDTGGSVPEKYRPIIFHDVDYDSLVIPGDDLSKAISLNICKSIVEALKGTIEAVYKEEGVVFSFWFPCQLRYE